MRNATTMSHIGISNMPQNQFHRVRNFPRRCIIEFAKAFRQRQFTPQRPNRMSIDWPQSQQKSTSAVFSFACREFWRSVD